MWEKYVRKPNPAGSKGILRWSGEAGWINLARAKSCIPIG